MKVDSFGVLSSSQSLSGAQVKSAVNFILRLTMVFE